MSENGTKESQCDSKPVPRGPTPRPPLLASATPPWRSPLLAAALCLGVTAIHIVDQGGLPGDKTPGYVQGLYSTRSSSGAC